MCWNIIHCSEQLMRKELGIDTYTTTIAKCIKLIAKDIFDCLDTKSIDLDGGILSNSSYLYEGHNHQLEDLSDEKLADLLDKIRDNYCNIMSMESLLEENVSLEEAKLIEKAVLDNSFCSKTEIRKEGELYCVYGLYYTTDDYDPVKYLGEGIVLGYRAGLEINRRKKVEQ